MSNHNCFIFGIILSVSVLLTMVITIIHMTTYFFDNIFYKIRKKRISKLSKYVDIKDSLNRSYIQTKSFKKCRSLLRKDLICDANTPDDDGTRLTREELRKLLIKLYPDESAYHNAVLKEIYDDD